MAGDELHMASHPVRLHDHRSRSLSTAHAAAHAGLALLIEIIKCMALSTHNDRYNDVARFWARTFGLNFVMGFVTGIRLSRLCCVLSQEKPVPLRRIPDIEQRDDGRKS
jgi:Cytochrome bd terminal oxidase subunit I